MSPYRKRFVQFNMLLIGIVLTVMVAAVAVYMVNDYRNSLRLASENGCHTVDFPSISTGIYRFPLDQAAQIAVREITRYLADHPEMTRVRMVCFDSRTYAAYAAALAAQECAG